MMRSPVLARKNLPMVVTSEPRAQIRDVANDTRDSFTGNMQAGSGDGGDSVNVVVEGKVGVGDSDGKETGKAKGGERRRGSTNVKGLCIDLGKEDDIGGQVVGNLSLTVASSVTPSGVVASAIKSLPLDPNLSLSPTLSRSNSGGQDESLPDTVCKGGPGKANCGLEVKEGQMGVECDICKCWYHTFCQSVSKPAYNALMRHPVIAFVCSFCKVAHQRSGSTPSHRSVGVQAVFLTDTPKLDQPSRSDHSMRGDPRSRSEASVQTLPDTSLDALCPAITLSSISPHSDHIAHLDHKIDHLSAAVEEQAAKLSLIHKNLQLVTCSMREQEGMAVEQATMMKRVLSENQSQRLLYSDAVKKTCDKMVGEVKDKLSVLPHPNSKAPFGMKEAQTVSKVFDDFLDRSKRTRNLVVHNFSEQQGETALDRSQADITLFTTMIRDTLKINVRATKSFRAGKSIPGKDRLLIITLENEDAKHDILRMASQLKSVRKWGRVFITPDLTFKERQEQKKLREELWRRREAGETNIYIRRGKIVQSSQVTNRGGRVNTSASQPPAMPLGSASTPNTAAEAEGVDIAPVEAHPQPQAQEIRQTTGSQSSMRPESPPVPQQR